MASVVRLIVLSLWFGGGVFLAIAGTPAAFEGAPDRATAGTIAGIMLRRWQWVSLIAPPLLLMLEWRSGARRRVRTVLLALAILAAAGQATVDTRLRSMRAAAGGGVTALSPDDPARRLFGALHGLSASLMGLQLLLALGVVISVGRERSAGSREA